MTAAHTRRQHLGRRICADLDRMPSAGPPAFDYYVVMIDDTRRGREAVVDPEITRREVIRRILTLEYDPEAISFIHHVSSDGVEDVTFAIISECALQALEGAQPMPPSERLAALHDHAQDERKNWRP
jgi:hypothetical protein